MRRWTKLLLLLLGLSLGAATWITLTSPPTAVAVAKERCATLRLGMSEAEMAAVLGGPPQWKDKLYGQWLDDLKTYATVHPKNCPGPRPDYALYDWYQWDFGNARGSRWSYHGLSVGAMFDRGRVVSFWYSEHRGNKAQWWLKRFGDSLSLNTSFLTDDYVGHDHVAAPPR
jgi:hypothetical protein